MTREKIRSGLDPVEERADERRKLAEEQKLGLTLAEAIEAYLTSGKLDALTNSKHRAQWRSTLETYVTPLIGNKLLVEVDVNDVKITLDPIWQSKHETATRVRSRLEAVFTWATVKRLRSGENPAIWKDNLKELMPSIDKKAIQKHHPAVALTDIGAWFTALNKKDGLAARAMVFLTLTASRSGEIRSATWDEIDAGECMWVIPAEHMKTRREHRVPLTRPAMALLHTLPRFAETNLIFPSTSGQPLSDMTLSAVMKRMHGDAFKVNQKGWLDPVQKKPAVPHGLRSTFRDWVAEKTAYPDTLAEVALSHKIGTAVEQAYRRGDMLAKRRQMMEDWASFVCPI
jgi:integrase